MRVISTAQKEVDQKWWITISDEDRVRYDEMMRAMHVESVPAAASATGKKTLPTLRETEAPTPYSELRAMALQAEEAGFDSVWVRTAWGVDPLSIHMGWTPYMRDYLHPVGRFVNALKESGV